MDIRSKIVPASFKMENGDPGISLAMNWNVPHRVSIAILSEDVKFAYTNSALVA
jgi:hypothetical protein